MTHREFMKCAIGHKTRARPREIDLEQTVPKTGDRGPETGPAYRVYEIVTNGPQMVRTRRSDHGDWGSDVPSRASYDV